MRAPPDIACLADRLGGEFWRPTVEKDVGARGLQGNDLRVDGCISEFVGRLADDYAIGTVAETGAHAGD